MKNKEIIKKSILYSYLFVFVIINSMIPNKTNVAKLSSLKTIMPGIENVYNSNQTKTDNEQEISYSFKFLEIIQNIF